MKQLFTKYDTNGSGELEWGEFWNVINDLELKLSDEEIGEWKKYADTNQNGSVCWAEFEPLAAELIAKFYSDHPPPEGSEEEWKEGTDEAGRQYRVNLSTGAQEWLEAEGRKEGMGPHLKHMHLLFEKHDTDKSGELEWGEFWAALTELGLELKDEEIAAWQQHADTDQNGGVRWAEFEPMADLMIQQYYSTHAYTGGGDPWEVQTDPEGYAYMLNRDTGETKDVPEDYVAEAAEAAEAG